MESGDNTEFYMRQADLPAPRTSFSDEDKQAVAIAQQMDIEERKGENNGPSFEQREADLTNAYMLSEGMLRAAVERFNDNKQFGMTDALSKGQIEGLQKTIADLKTQRKQLEIEKRTFQMNNPTPPPMNPPQQYPQPPQQYPPQPQQYPQQQPQPYPQQVYVPQQPSTVPVYPPQQTQADFMLTLLYQELQAMKLQLAEIVRNTTPVKQPKPRKRIENSTE